MTALYSPPQKVCLPLDDQYYQESSISDKVATGHKHVLYKQISPRRKFDQFGIDKTDYKAFTLSSTVYPTAVKTALLADLQESNPHKCGFDIVERPIALNLGSKTSSCFLSVPPPTAEQSHRGLSSVHSTPIVAFIEIPSGDMPGTRRTSLTSKSATASVVCSDVNARQEYPISDGNNDDALRSEGSAAPESEEVTSGDVSHRAHWTEGDPNNEGYRHPRPEPRRDLLAKPGSLKLVQQRLRAEKLIRSRMDGKENSHEEPKVFSYSRLDNTRLIRYQWQSRESRTVDERKDGGDIRDPMYMNTFCSEERPVRFKNISLPRLSRGSRPRPWTVGESSISNRTALLIANSRRSFTSPAIAPKAQTTTNAFQRNTWNTRAESVGLLPVVRKNFGPLKVDNDQQSGGGGGKEDGNDDVEEDSKEGNNTAMPLLEIRSCLANSAADDQRDKLKGKDGCLNSRVKQCVRFVRYRERLDKQEENRPMKSEGGRYRPFSKTDVRAHSIVNPPPTPEQKLQQSVETYQKYMENIARQTHLTSPRPFTFRGHSTGSSKPTHASLTTASSAIDTDSMIVQSVMDSNRPEVTAASHSRTSMETPRPQNSAIYTKDVSGVGHVLDIKRLSPKISTNRIVPGTRVALEKAPTPTPRYPSASTDEGVDMAETAPPTSRGDAIVVPMGGKSECPSEYSVSKDD